MSSEIATSTVASQEAPEKETETKPAKPATKIKTVDLPAMLGVELDYRILNAIPKHSKLEKHGLEKSIVENGGCKNRVKVWKRADGRLFLVEGLFRIETCLKHSLSLPHAEIIEGLKSREDAINHRIDLHLNRRNMSPRWIAYLWGEKYNQLKKPAHRQKSTDAEKGSAEVPQNEGDTSERLALEAGVGHSTIDRFSQFANAINKVGAIAGRDFACALLNAEIRLSKKNIIGLSEMVDEDIKAIAKLLKKEPKLKLEVAIQTIHPPKPAEGQSNENDGDNADDENQYNNEDEDETQDDKSSQEPEEDNTGKDNSDSNPADPDQVLEGFNHKLTGIWTALQDIKQVGDPERLHTLIKTLEDLLSRVKEIQGNSRSH
jgi:hypothetical protein